jgi:hypothetical protein
MHRTPSRYAAATLAAAALLLAAGCSGGPTSDSASGEDTTAGGAGSSAVGADQAPGGASPAGPPPVRFTTLPEPCTTLDGETVSEVVPKANPRDGEELTSSDTSTSGACLWSGLEGYQYRSLVVSLRRFDSDTALGDGDARAADYLQQMADEITGDDANKEVDAAPLADVGDEATTIAYQITEGTEREGRKRYVQQRVVVRTGNVVVTVDYSGTGYENIDEEVTMPSASDIKEPAETAARAAVAAVDASADDAADSSASGSPDENGAGDESGESSQSSENGPPQSKGNG